MHVELAARRREAVACSGRRPAVVRSGREQRPGHGGGVERVEVVENSENSSRWREGVGRCIFCLGQWGNWGVEKQVQMTTVACHGPKFHSAGLR